MTRKKWVLAGILTLVFVTAAAGGLFWALWQVPDFYAQAERTVPADPVQRQQAAKAIVRETTNLVNNVQQRDRWQADFRQDQINSWLVEELHQPKFQKLLPEGVREPRVDIEPDLVRIGFRMKYKAWDGVASALVRPWITEDGQLAVQVDGVRAGVVPVPLEDTLHQLSGQLERAGYPVSWRQSDGQDVAVIDLASASRRPIVLEALVVKDGIIRVIGGPANPKAAPAGTEPPAPREAAARALGRAETD
jgi:hypothetical protein